MHEEWAERFWSRVSKTEETAACWLWIGSRLPKGYGRFYPAVKVGLYAHRVSWEIANGRPVPEGLHVMHACDNPSCVNPAHLSVGTRSDNMRDAVSKGRAKHCERFGEQAPRAKLSNADVSAIKRRLLAGEAQNDVALEFGVTRGAITHIATGRSWLKCEAARIP